MIVPDVNLLLYGGEVYSNDADFSRFAGVRWVNPLTSFADA